MLDLTRVRILRELKLRGTVGAVAQALGYSPSAVSQQLAQLQREVGVPLVERAGRRLRLTEAGEVLAGHAEALLARAQQAEEETVAASGRVVGAVRVVGYQTALINLLAPVLPGLAERHPELTVEVIDEEFARVLQALVLQEVDIVITDEYSALPRPRRPELTAQHLITEPMRLALPRDHPAAAGDGPVRLADLAGDAWVTGHPGTNHAELLERACVDLAGYRPHIRHRTNDVHVMMALVGQASASCLFPDVGQAERFPGVVVRDLADAELRRHIVVWTRIGAEVRPSVRVVLEALRASAADLTGRFPSLTLMRPRGERDAGTGRERE
ncbi:DNA-binding transcriptional regulator, LysR family [Thermomonospora echinospora]|uniref:DNA-binding transcriptional regulator, LysR family n=1 Tax=Thermomonospora echinospora TaxID=1992 RepID=A0A1H5WD37_9ACTN|nr:LysR family transcriptional regulator [Thermomonospora echinospora]SEF97385.1 DNA-binding transcriptional regulator, LysR family [Thermomonospora echinospora]